MKILFLLAIASAPSLFAQPVVKQPCRTGVTTNCTPQAAANGSVAISGTTLLGGGTSLPATCAVSDQYFLTTGTTGNYSCTATNTWTLPGGGASPYSCVVTAVSSITCTHNLGTSTPWLACYDGSGNMLGGSTASTSVTNVVASSANALAITFSGTTTATCVISTGSMGPKGDTGATGPAGSGTVTNSGTLTSGNVIQGNGTTVVTDSGIAASALVKNNASNTYSTGTQDFTSATALKTPSSGGFAPTADASIGFDSTQGAYAVGGYSATGYLSRVVYSNWTVQATDCLSTDGGTYSIGGSSLACGNASAAYVYFARAYTFPSNSIITGKSYRITLTGNFTSPSSVSGIGFSVKLGSTVVYQSLNTGSNPVASVTNGGWGFTLMIDGTAAASASAQVDANQSTSTGGSASNSVVPGSALVATNGSLAFTVGMKFSSSTAGEAFLLKKVTVEMLN